MTGLRSDLASLALRLRTAFDWWGDELAAMLLPVLRRCLRSRTHRIDRDGRIVRGHHSDTLILPPETCLVRQIVVPQLPLADLRSMVALDADRLFPFPAEAAIIAMAACKDDGGPPLPPAHLPPAHLPPAHLRIVVGAMPHRHAVALGEELRRTRLAVRRVGPLSGNGPDLACDFGPALREASLLRSRSPAACAAWVAVALLVLAQVALPEWRERQALARHDATLASQQAAMTRVRRVEAALRDNRLLATSLARRTSHVQPLAVLGALDRVLPPDTHITQLVWDRDSLRLTGDSAAPETVAPALQTIPLLRAIHVRRDEGEGPPDLASRSPFSAQARFVGSPQ